MTTLETTATQFRRHDRPALKEVLNLAESFFMKQGKVYETMRRLAKRLDEENIA